MWGTVAARLPAALVVRPWLGAEPVGSTGLRRGAAEPGMSPPKLLCHPELAWKGARGLTRGWDWGFPDMASMGSRRRCTSSRQASLCGHWPPLVSAGRGSRGDTPVDPLILCSAEKPRGARLGLCRVASRQLLFTVLRRRARGFWARPWAELTFPTSCLWGSQWVALPPHSRPCSSSLFFLCPHSLGSPGQGRSRTWYLSASGVRAPRRPRTSSPWHQSPWHPPRRAAGSQGRLGRWLSRRVVRLPGGGGSPGWASPERLSRPWGLLF